MPKPEKLDPKTCAFYCQAMKTLNEAQVPFLIGGAYAFERYTGIQRHTKDLDVFVRFCDRERALEALSNYGCQTEYRASHWLGKAYCGDDFVDIIFNGANGLGEVDDSWFENAVEEVVLNTPVKICPLEETIFSKAFIMARDRYDGADIAHLISKCSDRINWSRLLDRFGDYWRVLMSHLILFGFIYPEERSRIPDWIMQELIGRLQDEFKTTPSQEKICQGTLLAPLQYQIDVEQWGYQDGRIHPNGNLTTEAVEQWVETLASSK